MFFLVFKSRPIGTNLTLVNVPLDTNTLTPFDFVPFTEMIGTSISYHHVLV